MKGLKRLIPGRKKKDKKLEDLSSDSNHSDQVSASQRLENNYTPTPAPASEPSGTGTGPAEKSNWIPAREINSEQQPDTRYTTERVEDTEYSSQGYENQSFSNNAENEGLAAASRQENNASMPEQSFSTQLNGSKRKQSVGSTQNCSETTVPSNLFDDAPNVVKSYAAVPLLEQTKLPRGGVSMETQAVGRVQVRETVRVCCAYIDMILYYYRDACFLFCYLNAQPLLPPPLFLSVSSVFLQKQSRTACALVCRYQLYTLCPWRDFVERWVQL